MYILPHDSVYYGFQKINIKSITEKPVSNNAKIYLHCFHNSKYARVFLLMFSRVQYVMWTFFRLLLQAVKTEENTTSGLPEEERLDAVETSTLPFYGLQAR